ncbi:MAG: glycoside hydrolase [Mucilaginibacter sp.]|uniref:GH39 family glycosyl hydrolase n=1 Tax=Mucilaginibacter sp. TaxID=1882438 RepID=UPI00326620BF
MKGFFLIITCFIYCQLLGQQVRLISADMNKPAGPLKTVFNECVGAGRANEGLRADWQQQLAMTKKECGFRYIRFHGILSDDMGVYQEDSHGQPIYNWQYVDQLYDFLLSIKVKPFIELSFMPNALKSTDQTIFWWKGNVSQPSSYKKWAELIKQMVKHLEARYGRKEVALWYFEVWNEPNLTHFFAGTQSDYFNLYKITTEAIKEVFSGYRVGGPATAGSKWITELITYCADNHVPIDFIATHEYGVDGLGLDVAGTKLVRLRDDPDNIIKKVAMIKDKISKSVYPKLELHMTEWNSSWAPKDPFHQTYQQAAYVLNTIKGTEGLANSMSYWTFTDIFEEGGPVLYPFSGSFGLINFQGIKKPVYDAYKYLNELSPIELKNTDKSSWVCRSSKGDAQILFWDFSQADQGKAPDQEYYRNILPPKPGGKVVVNLKNIPNGKYRLVVNQTGYQHNDVYTSYLRMGTPEQLSVEQVIRLKHAGNGLPIVDKEIIISNHEFSTNYTMNQNDVYFIKLIRR